MLIFFNFIYLHIILTCMYDVILRGRNCFNKLPLQLKLKKVAEMHLSIILETISQVRGNGAV
jgi:hypothetical protein